MRHRGYKAMHVGCRRSQRLAVINSNKTIKPSKHINYVDIVVVLAATMTTTTFIYEICNVQQQQQEEETKAINKGRNQ
eukprot:m.151427 g.151427  ORF g.151427 m.151427 type:complete len:78 (+) comp16199_c5_seq1:960-1193(+)